MWNEFLEMHLYKEYYLCFNVGLCVAYLNINNTNGILKGDDLGNIVWKIDNNSKNPSA